MIKKFLYRLPKLTKKRVITLAIIVALILGYGYYINSRKKNGFSEDSVKRGEVKEELILTGSVKAVDHAELGFETSGKLIYVGVSEGVKVGKGTLLGKLDTTVLNSAYMTALNNLRHYDANVDEVHDDVKDNDNDETFAQKNTRTTAEVAKDNAYEAVISAERNLKGASLYAPFEGVVTYVANPFAGVYVTLAQKQFEVINPETIYFEVKADQSEVTEIYEGMPVNITLDSFTEKQIRGMVERISYAPDPTEAGVVYLVKVNLEDIVDDGFDFRIGMTGDASFTMASVADVYYVPAGFISSDDKGKYLLTEKGNKKVYVELGLEGEEFTEVRGEISEGMKIYD